jgi:FHA domain
MMTGPPSDRSSHTEQVGRDEPAGQVPCRVCATPRTGDERFCESCGFDHTSKSGWSVEVSVDRAYFDRVDPDIAFPANRQTAAFEFTADEITIGRRSTSHNTTPDIDLSGELTDPGVSHAHAAVVRSADTGFVLTDLGSTNGTTVNDDDRPISPHVSIPIAIGDRIHVGAWTTLRLIACDFPTS